MAPPGPAQSCRDDAELLLVAATRTDRRQLTSGDDLQRAFSLFPLSFVNNVCGRARRRHRLMMRKLSLIDTVRDHY
jgi:hypothetical protein